MYLESVIKVLSPLRDAWSQITEATTDDETIEESQPPATRFAAKC
jgi:hypothetical protein